MAEQALERCCRAALGAIFNKDPHRHARNDCGDNDNDEDGLIHIDFLINQGPTERPNVSLPAAVPLQLRERIAEEEFFGTMKGLNLILETHGVTCVNAGCLCFLIGGLFFQMYKFSGCVKLMNEYLAQENRRLYNQRGLSWKTHSVEADAGKDPRGQKVTQTKNYVRIEMLRANRAGELAAHMGLELDHLRLRQQQLEMKSLAPREEAVQIQVSSGGPFQTLDVSELKLVRQIGEGAFGTVHIAMWRGSNVVVKKLKARIVNQEMVTDFVAEAALCEKVGRHPHVVSFIGATVKVPDLSLVFEFVPKGSLEKVLIEEKMFSRPSDLPFIVQLAADAASGLMHLHAEGVIHRDIAARNVLVTDQWRGKVCDFGMSRISSPDEDAQTKSNVGPLKWMAPESLKNTEYSAKSDVWMFGCLLWEIFTRTQPWPGKDALAAAFSVTAQDARMKIPNTVPKPIRSLMSGCWLSEPAKRPTMMQLHRALINFLAVVQAVDWSAVGDDSTSSMPMFVSHAAFADGAEYRPYLSFSNEYGDAISLNDEDDQSAQDDRAPLLE